MNIFLKALEVSFFVGSIAAFIVITIAAL